MSSLVYYCSFLIIVLLIIILFVRYYSRYKKKIPEVLFAEGLKKENNGQYEAAIQSYRVALTEVQKIKFYDSSLKNKIIQKLKVLDTVIEYRKNFHFER